MWAFSSTGKSTSEQTWRVYVSIFIHVRTNNREEPGQWGNPVRGISLLSPDTWEFSFVMLLLTSSSSAATRFLDQVGLFSGFTELLKLSLSLGHPSLYIDQQRRAAHNVTLLRRKAIERSFVIRHAQVSFLHGGLVAGDVLAETV